MFAVIKASGKQYKVAAQDIITVSSLAGEPGDAVTFPEVLTLTGDAGTQVGTPTVAGASVAGEIVEQTRGAKVIAFKKRRRQNSKRKRGHRQELTLVKITQILTDGAAPAPRAAKVQGEAGRDASNLSLIAGIGPTIEKKLRAAGITSWDQIASWSEADLAKWDDELKLRGRATREEWVVQAQELLAGKPPRAKADQAEAASGEDR
jgi:large subunit ribosomal protein L21